jgi:hypothetical protein
MAEERKPGLSDYVRQFFTNWNEYEGPASRKVALTLRNRARATLNLKGCCGHHGEPGC